MKSTPYEQQRRERGRAVFDELRRRGMLQKEPTEEHLDLLGDMAIYGDIQPAQDLQWIREACGYAEKVAGGAASRAERSLFWIRTAGVLLDIGGHYRASLELTSAAFGELPDVLAIRLTQTLVDAIRALAEALPEDELRYLEYRRHCECHPRQSAYRARLNKDGSIKPVSSKISGSRPQHESEDVLRGVLLRYGVDETRIAIEVAKRVLEPLRKVEAAAGPLCEATP